MVNLNDLKGEVDQGFVNADPQVEEVVRVVAPEQTRQR